MRPGARPRCRPTGGRASLRSPKNGRRTGAVTELAVRRGDGGECKDSGHKTKGAPVSDFPQRISVREVGPRDGLQNEEPVPTEDKIELIDRLSATGVHRIEAVSFVRPEAIPQMADADAVWRGIDRVPSVRYSALVPNLRGASRALDAGLTEIEAVVSAGGCPYEGDVPVDRVVGVAGRAVADGADSVSFGDTTGMATPGRVRELVAEFRRSYPDTALNLHFHNTRVTGLANVLTALELGVADFDASVGGLGGCPYAPGATGNIATEELVHMVNDMGIETGIDLDSMIEAAADAERIIGRRLPS